MSLLLRRSWHTPTSLLPSAIAMLLLQTGLGIFFLLIAAILVVVARVNEVPLLVLFPQVVVAHLGLLILLPILILRLGEDPLLQRGWRWGGLLLVPNLGLCLSGRRRQCGLGRWGSWGCRTGRWRGHGPPWYLRH